MLSHVIKSSICLLILLIFYKVFLEKKNIHIFKRFYLLSSFFLSLGIPFITFYKQIDSPVLTQNFIQTAYATFIDGSELNETLSTNYGYLIVWVIYGIATIFFGVKFFKNLLLILFKIAKNPNQKSRDVNYVLINDQLPPHTFLNYIFLNKKNYEDCKIPEEVILHEQTHAKQRHSLDILLIEIFQIFFWFNPLIYLFKNMVKLNHEFLADDSVVKTGISLVEYQKMILSFTIGKNRLELVNAINYTSLEKRLRIMKTKHSKKIMWYKNLILIPLVAFLIYGFGNEVIILENEKAKGLFENQEILSKDMIIEYNTLAKKYNEQPKEGMIISQMEISRMKYIYNLMSEKQKKNAEPFPQFPPAPFPPTSLDDRHPEKMEKSNFELVGSKTPKKLGSPPPPNPIGHLQDLSKRGASFYLDGGKVSLERAIKSIKKGESIGIQVINENSKRPEVRISTKVFDNK